MQVHKAGIGLLLLGLLAGVLALSLLPTLAYAQSASQPPTITPGSFTPWTQGGDIGGTAATPDNAGTIGAGLTTTGAPQVKRNPVPPTDELQNILTGIVYAFTVWIGSWVAYIGSYVFGFAAGITLQSQAYSLDFISKMWELVRDIANMAFLFLLIYIAFTVMFRADTRGTMQLLAGVITVALLVNFSFFFTRVVIDAGNILALQFYKTINVPNINGSQVKDLSAIIMQGTEVQTILNQQSFQHFAGEQTGVSGWFGVVGALAAIYVTVGIMLFILAAMFLAAGIKLLLRTVILWLAIIGSPLAFIAAALPNTRPHAKQWLKILVSHAFYPAIFLFLFLIIARFVESMGVNGSIVSQALLDAQGANGGILGIAATIASITIRLGFVIILLFVAMKLSDMISVAGGGLASRASGLYWNGLKFAGARAGGYIPTRLTGFAGAKAADRLGKTEFGNRGTVGPLLQRIGERASKVSVGGVTSYADKVKAEKEVSKKQAANLYDVETRNIAAKAAAKIKENKKAGLSPEEGMDAKDLEKINKWGKREMGSLGEDDVKTLANIFTQSQAKILDDIEKLKDKTKIEAKETFEEFSSHASLGKAMEQINELRGIRDELRGMGVVLSKVDTHTARGATMNDVALKEMSLDIKEALAEARDVSRDRTLAPVDRRMAEQNAINLQEAASALKKLKENSEKVGPEVGNRPAKSEFEVKA
jgi:hypothetical protein